MQKIVIEIITESGTEVLKSLLEKDISEILAGNRTKVLNNDAKIEMTSDYNPSESFGLYEVVTLALTFASGVGSQLLASWIYDKIKNSDEHAKIVYRGYSISIDDLADFLKQVGKIKEHNDEFQNSMKANDECQIINSEMKKVLFLAANPSSTHQLRLDEEARAIQEKIRLSEYRNSICFESRWAIRSSDVLQAINETKPTIVHFSGHGTSDGELVMQNSDGTAKVISVESISRAIATASKTVKLVVFNACFSELQAVNVVKYIQAAIGMSDSIGDKAACVFAAQLYSSIGFGHSLQISFNQAIAQLMLEGIPEENTPKLYVEDNMIADEIFLVQPS